MDLFNYIKIENISKYFKIIFKPIMYRLYDWYNLRKSKNIDTQKVQTICLILGPYRNLTTLFSSIVFLHPNCQVLNHAGSRIYGNKSVDFLSNHSSKTIENFIRFSIEISSKGERGSYGGSITFSHAFESRTIKDLYSNNFKQKMKKNNSTKSLIWKESLHNTNIIRSDKFDLSGIIKKEKKLRFILPIRNPLDCTLSNIKTGHASILNGIGEKSTSFDVLEKIIDEIHWFILNEKKYPSRFFYFFENDISEKLFIDIAHFLKVYPNQNWITNAKKGFIVRSKYEHNDNFVRFYKKLFYKKFSEFPLVLKKLQSFY